MSSRTLVLGAFLEATLSSGCVQDYDINKKDSDPGHNLEDDTATETDTDTTDTEFVPNELTPTIQFAVQACLRGEENPCPTDQRDGTESEFCIEGRNGWRNGLSSTAEFRNFQVGGEDSLFMYKEQETSSTLWEDGDLETIRTYLATIGNDPSYEALFQGVFADPYLSISFDLSHDLTADDSDDDYFVDDASVPGFVMCRVHETQAGDFHHVDSFVYLKGQDGSNCDLPENVESHELRGYCAQIDRSNEESYGAYYMGYVCDEYGWNCDPTESAIQSSGSIIDEAFDQLKVADEDGDGTVEYVIN